MSQTYAVSLIDRRTGSLLRVNGTAQSVLTRDPQAVATEFLRNRDKTLWDVRIDPLVGKSTAHTH
ncbi:MAG TPA: hypothetical protein VGC31_04220 [Paenirhodobacter sp.]